MIKNIKKSLAKATWPYRRRLSRSRQRSEALADIGHLKPIEVRAAEIRAASILLICRIPAETSGLLAFLSHYRKLGVDHLLLIDGSGSEEVRELLSSQDDCSVWQPLLGFKESEYDKRFFHALLHNHCIGKWTLCVDFDELLVFPYMETRSLHELTAQLEDCERCTLWAIQVEIYGSGPLLETDRLSSELCYFDPKGYYQTYGKMGGVEVRGGAGMRLDLQLQMSDIFPEKLQDSVSQLFSAIGSSSLGGAPCLNKIPLVKPDESFFYSLRNHYVTDSKGNWAHKWHPCPTGVLLAPRYHRQYCESLLSDSDGAEYQTRQIFGQPRTLAWPSIESILASQLRINPSFSLMEKWSVKFQSSESLIDCGLMSDGGSLRPASRFAT